MAVGAIAAETGFSKGSVSGYLNEIEERTGVAFIRGKARNRQPPERVRGTVHSDRDKGLRRASVRDFHSFRTTWITLALTSKLPLVLVQKVTGHRTVEVVMKHYFRPNRAHLKAALTEHMPALLTEGGVASTQDKALATLQSADESNWRDVIAETIALLEGSS